MSETKNPGEKKLSVSGKTLTLKPRSETGTVRQSFSHGRSKQVVVEKVKRRMVGGETKAEAPSVAEPKKPAGKTAATPAASRAAMQAETATKPKPSGVVLRTLTEEERSARAHALADSRVREAEERKIAEEEARRRASRASVDRHEREAADARKREPDRMSARQAWRAIQAGLPKNAIISSDIGNNCAIGNAYPTFDEGRKYLAPGLFGPCGYGFPVIIGAKIGNPDIPCVGFAGDGAFGISMSEMSSIGRDEYPGITMVVFRNYQWGAEKRNSILWFDDNFVGTELDPHLSYAKVAEGCGLKGVTVRTQAELTEALRASCEAQKKRVTTFIEVILNQELGEPFRRDAMKKPTVVAGIRREDMRPQHVA